MNSNINQQFLNALKCIKDNVASKDYNDWVKNPRLINIPSGIHVLGGALSNICEIAEQAISTAEQVDGENKRLRDGLASILMMKWQLIDGEQYFRAQDIEPLINKLLGNKPPLISSQQQQTNNEGK